MSVLAMVGCSASAPSNDEPVVESRLTTDQQETNDALAHDPAGTPGTWTGDWVGTLATERPEADEVSREDLRVPEPVEPVATGSGERGVDDGRGGIGVIPGSVPAVPSRLDADGLRAVLRDAGWPEALWDDAARVAFCESRWNPGAIGDNGVSLGLFQLGGFRPGWNGWFVWAGEDEGDWRNPVTNARTAYAVYRYDIDRGNPPWHQWSCRWAVK